MKSYYSISAFLIFIFLFSCFTKTNLSAADKRFGISGDTLSGYGKKVNKISMTKGFYTVQAVSRGESDFNVFIVKVYDNEGEIVKYLFTESGNNFEGETTLKIPETGKYVIEVDTSGMWLLIFE